MAFERLTHFCGDVVIWGVEIAKSLACAVAEGWVHFAGVVEEYDAGDVGAVGGERFCLRDGILVDVDHYKLFAEALYVRICRKMFLERSTL